MLAIGFSLLLAITVIQKLGFVKSYFVKSCVTLLRQRSTYQEYYDEHEHGECVKWCESHGLILGGGEPEEHTAETHQYEYKQEPQVGVHMVNLLVSLVAAVAAIVTGFFVYRQIVAFRNSERSWVLADIEEFSIKDVLLFSASGSRVVPIFCTLKNYGVKPVWITAASFELRVVESVTLLPKEPDYGTWEPFESEIPLLPESSGRYMRYPVSITTEECGFVMSGKQKLYVYGFVTYKDTFRSRRKSRFCFCFSGNPPRFVCSGPKGYNKYT